MVNRIRVPRAVFVTSPRAIVMSGANGRVGRSHAAPQLEGPRRDDLPAPDIEEAIDELLIAMGKLQAAVGPLTSLTALRKENTSLRRELDEAKTQNGKMVAELDQYKAAAATIASLKSVLMGGP